MEEKLCTSAEASRFLQMQSTDKVWLLDDVEETRHLGEVLATQIPALTVLLLEGPLGAGKTSIVQGMAKALGITEPVTSPTFAIAQHYPSGCPPLIHIDLYRLEEPHSADELFIQEEEEAQAIGAIMAIEWSERLAISIPEAWRLNLTYQSKKGRIAQLTIPSTDFKNLSTSASVG